MWTMSIKMMIILHLLSGTFVKVLCDPDLNPSVPDGSAVYINQPVTIHCITRGSQAMAWRSDEYIGSGRQLAFNSGSTPGAIDTSPNGAQATFVRMDNDNGELMLQSILSISVVSIHSSFTITCHNIDTGSTDGVTYQTMNENITSVTMLPFDEEETCPNNNIIIECTARNSRNIQWGSSDNIGLSNIMPRCSSGGLSQTYNISGIGVISSYVQVSNSDGLVCRLTLPSEKLPVDVPLYITCTNLDFQISANISFEIPGDCVSTTTPTSNPVTSVINIASSTDFISEGTETKDAVREDATPEVHVDLIQKRTVIPAVGVGIAVGIGILVTIIVIILGIIFILRKTKEKEKKKENEEEGQGKEIEEEKEKEEMGKEGKKKGLEIFISEAPHSPTVSESSGADLVMNEHTFI